jgi:MFS family permease
MAQQRNPARNAATGPAVNTASGPARSTASRPAGNAATVPAVPASRRRWVLPQRSSYTLAAAVIFLCLFGSVVPSPLYGIYAAAWHFSALTVTLIYATYAFGVLAALLVAGRVSDQVGRRPVLLAALGTLMVCWVLFIAAQSTAWLFVARGLQGLATGTALSAASAALLDLHWRRDPVSVGLANAVASCAGLGLGLLASAALVQAGTAPRVIPFVMLLVLYGVALAATYWMPEPVQARGRLRLTVQRPSVPVSIRHPFLLASLAVLGSWSIGGLFFSIGAQLSAHLFSTANVIVAGVAGILLTVPAALAQLAFHRVPAWLGAAAGSAALTTGLVLIVIATATDSRPLFLAGSFIAGIGFGTAFLGGLRQLTAVIPAEHRAAVMSAFYLVAYASLSVPAVIAGLVVTHLGLQTTFEVFGSIVAGIALIMSAEAWRTRPRRARTVTP